MSEKISLDSSELTIISTNIGMMIKSSLSIRG